MINALEIFVVAEIFQGRIGTNTISLSNEIFTKVNKDSRFLFIKFLLSNPERNQYNKSN